MAKKKGVVRRLDLIDARMKRIEREEKVIEKEEKVVEKKLNRIEKEEENIEKVILRIGKVGVRKRHLLELIRASAGAFLGVGIGRGLIGLDGVAKNLSWLNIIAILFFILGISFLLIYKDEKGSPKSGGKLVLFQRLFFIYAVSVIIELISIFLFNVSFDSSQTLAKIIIVGSYTAMASAITFSLAK